jgi:REP element-mobilizing transposase RayT
MPQSLAQIYLHVIFSTKNRAPFLQNQTVRRDLHAYLAGTCRNLHAPTPIVGGVADHVHLLCRFPRTLTVADLLQHLKGDSSHWIKTHDASLAEFAWQNGYGAFSVSPGHLDALQHYIANQEEHHRKESFQDEFRRILHKYGVEFDERYVWD